MAEIGKFQQLVREKAAQLRCTLEVAAASTPDARKLLNSMQLELRRLEDGSITPPYDISRWAMYLGPEFPIYSSNPDAVRAFGELHMVLEHGDMGSYQETYEYLERLAVSVRSKETGE